MCSGNRGVDPNTPSRGLCAQPVPGAEAPDAAGDSSPMSLQPPVPVIPLEPPEREQGYSYALDLRPRPHPLLWGEGCPFPLGASAWMGGRKDARPASQVSRTGPGGQWSDRSQPGRPHTPGSLRILVEGRRARSRPLPGTMGNPPDTPAHSPTSPGCPHPRPSPRAPGPPSGQEGSPGAEPSPVSAHGIIAPSSETSGQESGLTLRHDRLSCPL